MSLPNIMKPISIFLDVKELKCAHVNAGGEWSIYAENPEAQGILCCIWVVRFPPLLLLILKQDSYLVSKQLWMAITSNDVCTYNRRPPLKTTNPSICVFFLTCLTWNGTEKIRANTQTEQGSLCKPCPESVKEENKHSWHNWRKYLHQLKMNSSVNYPFQPQSLHFHENL